MALPEIKKLLIPDTNVYVVDGNGDGDFDSYCPSGIGEDGKIPEGCDYFEKDGKAIYLSFEEMKTRPWPNFFRLSQLEPSLAMTELEKLFASVHKLKSSDEKTRQEARQALPASILDLAFFVEGCASPDDKTKTQAEESLEQIAQKSNVLAANVFERLLDRLCVHSFHNGDWAKEPETEKKVREGIRKVMVNLAHLHKDEAIPYLIYNLYEYDDRVQEIPNGLLVNTLIPFNSEECRWNAALALGEIGSPDADSAVPILIGALHYKEPERYLDMAGYATVALADMGGPAARWAIGSFLEMLKSNKEEDARIDAALALGAICQGYKCQDDDCQALNQHVIEALQEASQKDTSEKVRQAARQSLKKLQGKK